MNRRFSKAAKTYDRFAVVQDQVALNLVKQIGNINPKTILEIGCGTGLLTTRLLEKYPQAKLTITDISDEMLATTKQKIQSQSDKRQASHHSSQSENSAQPCNCTFKAMNPEREIKGQYDLIVSSMAIHWFENIEQTLERIKSALNPGGAFYFSTIGPDCFTEWKQALTALNLPIGLRVPPTLDGIMSKTTITIPYGTAHAFLTGLKNTGAYSPKSGYRPLSPLNLKAAMKELEASHNASITWHIHYGKLTNQ